MSKQTFDKGLTLDMKTTVVLSIHSVRVMEGKVFSDEEVSDTEEAGEDDSKVEDRAGKKGTFFDAWTWQLYAFQGADPEDEMFRSEFID